MLLVLIVLQLHPRIMLIVIITLHAVQTMTLLQLLAHPSVRVNSPSRRRYGMRILLTHHHGFIHHFSIKQIRMLLLLLLRKVVVVTRDI